MQKTYLGIVLKHLVHGYSDALQLENMHCNPAVMTLLQCMQEIPERLDQNHG